MAQVVEADLAHAAAASAELLGTPDRVLGESAQSDAVLDDHPTGGAALVRYLLNAPRSYTLRRNGLTALKPTLSATLSGKLSSVPRSLRSVVGAR